MIKKFTLLKRLRQKACVRLAGTALVLMLASVTVFSQDFQNMGNLTYPGNIDVGTDSYPTFADLDGDTDLDLYVGTHDGYINIYTNDGSGNFTASGMLQADGSNLDVGFYSFPTFADLDGDSDLDLYVGEKDGYINVYINDGAGNFTTSGMLQADGINIDVGTYSYPTFADLDGDNDLDLYIGEYDGYINVYINDGSGNFTASGMLQADGSNLDVGYQSSHVFADLDEDSDLDLYVGDTYGNIYVYSNDGAGNFTADGRLQADGSNIDVGFSSCPTFADLNGDNDLDLYVGGQDGYINVYINGGAGNFIASGILQADGINIDVGTYSCPTFADLDGDNDLDLYVGGSSFIINVYINDGAGNFTPDGILDAGGVYCSPAFADLDGDNDLDLYVGVMDGYINVYINDGAGNFTTSGMLQADGINIDIGTYSYPTFADLDGDNDLDLYIGEFGGYINIYTNDGSGNFTASGRLQADGSDINDGRYSYPTFADLDGDNDLDLYVGGDNGYINVYINDGAGNFTADGRLQADGNNIDVGSRSSPVFADLDEDTDLDLYIGEKNGSILFYMNTSAIYPDINNLDDIEAVCSATPTTPTATDYLGNTVTGTTTTTFPVTSKGTTVITWTYDDSYGNTTTQTQNVIISDAMAPVADVATLDDITAECEVTALTAPTATDNCAGTVTGTPFIMYLAGNGIDNRLGNTFNKESLFIIFEGINVYICFYFVYQSHIILRDYKEYQLKLAKRNMNLNWLGNFQMIFAIGYFGITFLHAVFFRNNNDWILLVNFTWIIILFYLICYIGYKYESFFIQNSGSGNSQPLASSKQDIKKVDLIMKEQKPFLDPKLSIYDLSLLAEISPRNLSILINKEFKMNFSRFVNNYRIDAFKQALRSPKYRNFTINAISFECGFNSKASFNRIFKEHCGLTPMEYKNLQSLGRR